MNIFIASLSQLKVLKIDDWSCVTLSEHQLLGYVEHYRPGILKEALEKGYHQNRLDENGKILIQYLFSTNYINSIKHFLIAVENGADITHIDDNGDTFLHVYIDVLFLQWNPHSFGYVPDDELCFIMSKLAYSINPFMIKNKKNMDVLEYAEARLKQKKRVKCYCNGLDHRCERCYRIKVLTFSIEWLNNYYRKNITLFLLLLVNFDIECGEYIKKRRRK